MSELVSLLQKSWEAREPLRAHGHTGFYRALHITEHPDFTLDVVQDTGILSLYEHLDTQQEQNLFAAIQQALPLQTLYLKRRPVEARHVANVQREHLSPSEPIWGPPTPEVVALEAGVPFLFRPGSDLSVGLFADMRNARTWVRNHAPARVLNTFSYTCGFGVSAALGGSSTVKNVDASRKVLDWGKENYGLSGLAADPLDFIFGDVQEWFRRFHKRGDRFDLVVLDPPSFSRSKQGIWRAEKDYGQLVSEALPVLSQDGMLLACCNHAGLSLQAFKGMVQKANPGLKFDRLIPVGEDFPARGESHLKITLWGR